MDESIFYQSVQITSSGPCVFSGVAAVLLNLSPNSSSAELLQQLLYHSVKQVINPESLPQDHRLTTPNMVVALPDPTSTLAGQSSRVKLLQCGLLSKNSNNMD